MIRISAWQVEAGGRSWTVEPLTVRQRIALVEAFADERARKAMEDGRASQLAGPRLVEVATTARDGVRAASFLVGQCFTLDGAHRILRVAAGDEAADAILTHLEPADVAPVALEAIGIDVSARSSTEGNG